MKELFQFPVTPSKATQPGSDPRHTPRAQLSGAYGTRWSWDTVWPSLSSPGQSPEQNPARSRQATSLTRRNSTRRAEVAEPEMLGREEGQLCSPALHRSVLPSFRVLSSASPIRFKTTLQPSFLFSNNHSLLFLSLLSSFSRWLVISESPNLHLESPLSYEKAVCNKILLRNVWLPLSAGAGTRQGGKHNSQSRHVWKEMH